MKKNVSPTEYLETPNSYIDKLDDDKAISIMLKSHLDGLQSLEIILPIIKKTVASIIKHFNGNKVGRIIYSGAGTSARIAVQDGSELYPTFGWPKYRTKFIIAGGNKALLTPIENAEDDIEDATRQVELTKVCEKDVIIGLAASGNTPFTCKVMEEAKKLNALTIGISNNSNGKILDFSKYKIILDTGGEVIAGSTRLKAGTAQKVCLNLISTFLMIKLGKVKNGKMVNLIATNKKLRYRQKQILESFN